MGAVSCPNRKRIGETKSLRATAVAWQIPKKEIIGMNSHIARLAIMLALALPIIVVAASVGTLDSASVNCVRGVGEVCDPGGEETSYPDFIGSVEMNAYLIFGGDYDSDDWADWENDVKYYAITAFSGLTRWFGVWVSGCGDINNDGDNDVMISDLRVHNYLGWNLNTAICYLLYDIVEPMSVGCTGLDLNFPSGSASIVTLSAVQEQSRLGCCLEIVGDVNNDNYDDIVVGESGWDPSSQTDTKYECGRAYVMYGSSSPASLFTSSGSLTAIAGENRNDHFGAAISSAGNLDGDDYFDFAVGAPWYDKTVDMTVTGNVGRVYVFLGESSPDWELATDADIIITGDTADSFFGCAIGVGDFDGDTDCNDLIIGAYGYNNQAGRAYIFYDSTLTGDGDGLLVTSQADVVIDGDNDIDLLGSSVASAGAFFDLTAGKKAAAIVGAPNADDTKGAFYIFDLEDTESSPLSPTTHADYSGTGVNAGDFLGLSVTNVALVDDDGDSDVAVIGASKIHLHDKN